MLTESESALARAVLIHGPISRSALTARLGLSPASLTRLAKPFLDRGLFVELDEVADGSVGRPTRPLDISPDLGLFVGVKLTGDRVYACAHRRARPARRTRGTGIRRPRSRDGGRRDRRCARRPRRRTPNGIGVSIGGVVRDGFVEFAPFLGWYDVDLATLLEARDRRSRSPSRTTSSRSRRRSAGSGWAAASRDSR